MRLDSFDNTGFDRGRPWLVEAAWQLAQGLLFGSWIPGSWWRVALLRAFGAEVGRGVVIRPRVRVKFPWRLSIGDHSWVGEGAWIDNLALVRIGEHCCLSQGVYLCTGNHRWDEDTFDLVVAPIRVGDRCWIGAMARIGPGVTCGPGAVLELGSVATSDLESDSVHAGVPARRTGARQRADGASSV